MKVTLRRAYHGELDRSRYTKLMTFQSSLALQYGCLRHTWSRGGYPFSDEFTMVVLNDKTILHLQKYFHESVYRS